MDARAAAGLVRGGSSEYPRGVRHRSVALLAPLVLAACGPSDEEVAGAVLLFAPLVYLLAMAIVAWLYGAWKSSLPELRFGTRSHTTALALLAGPAIYGAGYADPALLGAVLVVFGASALAWWLLLARVTLRSGWGFRWGGLAATGLLVAPLLLGLLWPARMYTIVVPTMRVYLYSGGLGIGPLVLLIALLVEAALAGRAARAAVADDGRESLKT